MGPSPSKAHASFSSYIKGKREAKRFWRLVCKYHPDYMTVAEEFNRLYPQYPVSDTLMYLCECKELSSHFPGRVYIPAAKSVSHLSEEQLSGRTEINRKDEEANLPQPSKRAIFDLDRVQSYLQALNNDDPASIVHNQKVLIIARRMLRNYLISVIDGVVDLEQERRNLLALDDSVLRIRDARLVYAAVESIGGTLKVSTEAETALNKLPPL